MDRQMTYPGAIPLDTDILKGEKNAFIGLAKLAHAVLGDGPWLKGLSCVPTGPASLQVVVNPGQIYALENLDATAYGSLAADTTHQILKQGILMDAVTLSCPAPGTAGQSINYLIEVGYLDTDGGSTVLPYYNSSNPAVAYNGPNNSGTSQNTVRQGQCSVQVKAGTAAATGSQSTPAPDAGYIGAAVVTVANGQTTITAANINAYAGAPFLASAAANGAAYINSSITLSVGNSGMHALLAGTSTTVTLWTPVNNSWTRAKFTGTDSNTQTISTPAGVIYLPNGTSAASVTVTNGQSVDLVSDGANWRMVATTIGLSRIGANDSFASGTVMPFYQAAAPTGWTQVVTQNDKAMRVVSGAGGGSGGTVAFSAITSQNVAGHQLTIAEMPSHTHNYTLTSGTASNGGTQGPFNQSTVATSSTGGDGAHSHGVGFQPSYIDLIIASKN